MGKLKDRQTSLRGQVETLRRKRASYLHALAKLSADSMWLQERINAHSDLLQEAKKRREALEARRRQAIREIEVREANVSQARIAYLRAEAKMKASKEGSCFRAMEAIRDAEVPGVHGPLAELGSAADEIAHALEIAAGGKLRVIVVNDDQVATRCIDLLKEQRVGRETFLALSKLPPPRRLLPPDEEGVLGYAIHLIDFDPRYAAAFHVAFDETLIVRHINAAQQLIGKYRMVTLEGDVLERSGAMTGGYDGRMPSARFMVSIAHDLKEAKTDVEVALERLDRSKVSIRTIRQAYEANSRQVRRLQEDIRKQQFKFAKCQHRKRQVRQTLEELETELAAFEAKHQGMEAWL